MSTLRELLAAVGEPLVTVVAAPAGLDVPISGVAIVDPDDEPDEHRGSLVLVVGARGRDAVPLVRAAGAAGAAAVAVKVGAADASRSSRRGWGRRQIGPRRRTGPRRRGGSAAGDTGPATRAALRGGRPRDGRRAARRTAGRALGAPRVARRRRARRGRKRRGPTTCSRSPRPSPCSPTASSASRTRPAGCSPTPAPTATTGRSTSCAGSPSSAGRAPRTTCATCGSGACSTGCARARRSCGSTSTPSSACGAGSRSASTPARARWARSGCRRARSRSRRARRTCSSARPASRRGTSSGAAARAPTWHRDLVEGLLDGRASPDLVAGTFGLDEHAPTLVVGFAVRAGEGVTRELSVAELADVVAVHAAGYRRAALTAWRGDTVYAVLPDVATRWTRRCGRCAPRSWRSPGAAPACGCRPGSARRASRSERARRGRAACRSARITGRGRPGAGRHARRTSTSPRSTTCAPRCCSARPSPCCASGPTCATRPSTRSWPTTASTAATSRARCSPGSTPSATSAPPPSALTVHPNTLRYRVRRAVAVAGLRLGDPRARLVHHLHLLGCPIGQRARHQPDPALDESAGGPRS